MNILQTWAESLFLLKPENLKKFLYVTARSLKLSYPLYLVYALCVLPLIWVVLLGIALAASSLDAQFRAAFNHVNISFLVSVFFGSCAIRLSPIALSCLAARPSVGVKKYDYFKKYILSLSYYLVIFCLIAVVGSLFRTSFVRFSQLFVGIPPKTARLALLALGALFGPTLLITLTNFYFDLERFNFLRSLRKALIMNLYNLPIAIVLNLIISLSFYVAIFCLTQLVGLYAPLKIYAPLTSYLFFVLLAPIPTCIITNFYIMKLHQQPDLYFEKPGKE